MEVSTAPLAGAADGTYNQRLPLPSVTSAHRARVRAENAFAPLAARDAAPC